MNNSTAGLPQGPPMDMGEKSQTYRNLEAYALGYWHVHPYLSLLICSFGILTNLVNIVILTRKKMVNSINCVLTGIAVSDIITMADYIPFAVHFYLANDIGDLSSRYTWGWSYYLAFHSCLSNTTHTISIWLAVSMSAMRYVFIESHGNSKLNLSIQKTCFLIVGIFCTSVFLFIPNYIITKVEPQNIPPLNTTIYRIKNMEIYLHNSSTMNTMNVWIFVIMGKILPCFLIAMFGGLLLRTLSESKKLSKSLNQTSCSQRMKAHKRTTVMLLTIVLMFLIAELPSGVLVVVSVFVDGFFMNYYQLFADTLDILSLINNAVNFVMYCSMSRQFRECLADTLPSCGRNDNRAKYQLAAQCNSRAGTYTVATNV